jgi:hypothetical protein
MYLNEVSVFLNVIKKKIQLQCMPSEQITFFGEINSFYLLRILEQIDDWLLFFNSKVKGQCFKSVKRSKVKVRNSHFQTGLKSADCVIWMYISLLTICIKFLLFFQNLQYIYTMYLGLFNLICNLLSFIIDLFFVVVLCIKNTYIPFKIFW